MPISPVQGIGVRCIPQLVAPIDARVGGLHPAMSARATSTLLEWSASWPSHPPAWPTDFWLRNLHRACGFTFERGRKSFAPFRRLRKASPQKVTKKGVYGGLHFKSRALTNYLRRRSPGPPFPPDHRQAGERGAIYYIRSLNGPNNETYNL
eukprot:scaffold76707_cov70-Phaeocystis_antarctica.AAC.1